MPYQVDAIVSSVNREGIFADVGPLPTFVSKHVRLNEQIVWPMADEYR